jgi:hypothetical protein
VIKRKRKKIQTQPDALTYRISKVPVGINHWKLKRIKTVFGQSAQWGLGPPL